MIIDNSYRLARIGCLSVRILDHKLESLSNFKYLEVLISEDLTWNHHVKYLTTKINQRLGVLKRIKYLLPFEACMLFYNGLVIPLFDYTDIVLGDKNNSTLMNNIQILQNKAAKILDRPIQSSSTEALAAMKWITLKKWRLYHRCLYVYECVNDYIDHSKELLTQGEICSYNLRNKNNLRLPRVVRNWGKFRTCYHAVKDWNWLAMDIRNSANISLFKRKLMDI